ncbi:hypothetical protein [Terrabacter sp. MAHUQ-38]|nr:hypothetical protein [Terrabacter sp. MAHUQ-38]MBC9822876.1 hypothetical protein [Terrabacter sp. MAHUQ-38]
MQQRATCGTEHLSRSNRARVIKLAATGRSRLDAARTRLLHSFWKG